MSWVPIVQSANCPGAKCPKRQMSGAKCPGAGWRAPFVSLPCLTLLIDYISVILKNLAVDSVGISNVVYFYPFDISNHNLIYFHPNLHLFHILQLLLMHVFKSRSISLHSCLTLHSTSFVHSYRMQLFFTLY